MDANKKRGALTGASRTSENNLPPGAPYPYFHSGPCIVAGSAWSLHEDLERALSFYGNVPIIAVNGAAGEVKAFALFTQHPREMPRWIKWQQDRFGDDFTTHAAGKAHLMTKLGAQPQVPWVDYWWDDVASGGTSSWGARKMAAKMGFSTVVLCGVPLSKGPYAYGKVSKWWKRDDTVAHYREQIMKDSAWHKGVVSMSGWTREVFGCG